MNSSTRTFAGLPAALAWVFAFMLATGWQALHAIPDLMKEESTLGRTIGLKFWGTPLGTKTALYLIAVIAAHIVWGLLVYFLARLTVSVFPRHENKASLVVTFWFGLSALTLLAFNAATYAWSNSGLVGFGWAAIPLATLLATCVLYVAIRYLRSRPKHLKWVPRVAVYSVLLGIAWMTLGRSVADGSKLDDAQAVQQPNIILIGIDSLRPDVIGGSRKIGLTPNIDRFLHDAHEFTHSITPLARTFPTWVSILSGKYPINSGARENLIPRPRLTVEHTLPELLRKSGYRTAFGIDETRFANIDESFGFDTVIAPTMGAPDWVLATINDLPLTNLLSNVRVGRWLFPASYGNRAAAHVYQPHTYVDLVDQMIDSGGPQFIALHLTLPHWPYHHAQRADRYFNPADDSMYAYLSEVISVDRQFGELMELLEEKRLLEKSIVVLLSDHGEAVNLPARDSILAGMQFDSREETKGLTIPLAGHGNSVLSPSQYHTVLAIRGYGDSGMSNHRRRHEFLVSSIDLMPSILDLIGAQSPEGMDGQSFADALRDKPVEGFDEDRVVLTETGLVAAQVGTQLDESKIAEQADFYRMNTQNARLEFREDMLDEAVSNKERAAISSRWTLVRIPARGDTPNARYLAFDRKQMQAFTIDPTKLDRADPEVARLAGVLSTYYGDEVPELALPH